MSRIRREMAAFAAGEAPESEVSPGSEAQPAAAIEEPVVAEAESEPVGASDVRPAESAASAQSVVVSEVMERETPVEAATDEPRGWLSSLLGPRREGGAAADTEASKPEIEQAAGEAVGSLEFIGLWKENKEKHDRLMPIKIEGYADRPNWETDRFTNGVRVAFGRLVDELVRSKAPSGILAISTTSESWEDEYGVTFSTNWGISWSAIGARTTSYQRLGLISMQAPQSANIRFADFDGAIGVPGDLASEANAVYRVTLPSGGLDPWKWVSRPPPLAPEELYTGPRDDGLVSSGEISGEYDGCFVMGCSSMTVVPHGPDAIETWSSNLCCCCPFFSGPRVGGSVWTRKQHTNEFLQLPHGAYGAQSMTCSADGLDVSGSGFLDCVRKRPNSQKRSFRKVETKDLAGQWRGCGGTMCCVGFCCYTKKALNEDQYEASTCSSCCCLPGNENGSFCCLPINENGSKTRTRKYVNGHPTNAFARDDSPHDVHWFRDDSGCTASALEIWGGNPVSCRIAKKTG